MENNTQLSPWTLPKLHAPASIKKPSKRGRFNASNGLYPIETGRRTISGLSKTADLRLKPIPSRDSINTVTMRQADKTDKIRRGGI